MIKEHEDIMEDISIMLTDILSSYAESPKFYVRYLNHELGYHILEISILKDKLTDNEHQKFVREIKKSDIITDIYTIENGKLYTVSLKPLEEIRSNKINKLQKKITQ